MREDWLVQRDRFNYDIKPISELRFHTAALIRQTQRSGRPLLITQQGNRVTVLLDFDEYEKLLARLELLQDSHIAEAQLDSRQAVLHKVACKQAMERLG